MPNLRVTLKVESDLYPEGCVTHETVELRVPDELEKLPDYINDASEDLAFRAGRVSFIHSYKKFDEDEENTYFRCDKCNTTMYESKGSNDLQ